MSFGEVAKIDNALSKAPEMASVLGADAMREYKMRKEEFLVESGENANGSYKIFRNGTVLASLTRQISADQSSIRLTFPIHFPNQVTCVQFVGSFTPQVTKLSQQSVELSFQASAGLRELQIIVSGI